mmetsp:Transcript_51141/g.165561  ORF Transcript_51141/g.165561 Transcript_51141/m.165561 type:complete len:237 (+) Transcript_51141:2305-3015(+)
MGKDSSCRVSLEMWFFCIRLFTKARKDLPSSSGSRKAFKSVYSRAFGPKKTWVGSVTHRSANMACSAARVDVLSKFSAFRSCCTGLTKATPTCSRQARSAVVKSSTAKALRLEASWRFIRRRVEPTCRSQPLMGSATGMQGKSLMVFIGFVPFSCEISTMCHRSSQRRMSAWRSATLTTRQTTSSTVASFATAAAALPPPPPLLQDGPSSSCSSHSPASSASSSRSSCQSPSQSSQ